MKILITGTTRGIGRAIAVKFLHEGHTVIGIDRREGSIHHPAYTHHTCDIRDYDRLPAIDGVEIVECSGKDVAGWCGRMYDAVAASLPDSDIDAIPVYHISQPALDLAANIAATRPMGDGAWAWDRNKSQEDISPLVAATMALGAATQIDQDKQKLYESVYNERGVLIV